jgi:hypothetical protein
MVILLALFTGPGGLWAIAYLGVLVDSRDGCEKTVVNIYNLADFAIIRIT